MKGFGETAIDPVKEFLQKNDSATSWAVRILAGLVGVLLLAFAARPMIVLLHLAVGNDTEVVIGELEVVLGLHPVAVVLGVLRELLVLVEHLRRVAACAAVDPVALITAAAALIAIAPAAAAG